MKDVRLSYLGFEVSDLEAWARFLRDLVGMEVLEESGGLVARMDEHARRLILREGPRDDLIFCGWEAADEAEYAAGRDRLKKFGFEVAEGRAEAAQLRGVRRFTPFSGPEGVPYEIAWGAEAAAEPFRSSRLSGGFVTGDAGLGHVVFLTQSLRQSEDLLCAVLGARLSDNIVTKIGEMPLQLAFLHTNPRHHSVAFGELPIQFPKRLQHFMLEYSDLADVGLAYERMLAADVPIAQHLGLHPNDRMLSFYCRTPSGFELELGWGGVRIDDAAWTPVTYDRLSVWGHHRSVAGHAGAAQ